MSPPNRKRKNRIRIAPAPAASQHHSLPSNADGEQATPSSSIEEKGDRMHQKQARTDKPSTIPQSTQMKDAGNHNSGASKPANAAPAKAENSAEAQSTVPVGELKYLATKADIVRVETELKGVQEHIRENLAIKEDVANLIGRVSSIEKNMATKEDIANVRTEIEIATNRLLYRLLAGMVALLSGSIMAVWALLG